MSMRVFVALCMLAVANASPPIWHKDGPWILADGKINVTSYYTNSGTPSGVPSVPATPTNPWLRVHVETSVEASHWVGLGLFSLIRGLNLNRRPTMYDVDVVLLMTDAQGQCQVKDSYIYNYLPVFDDALSKNSSQYPCANNIYTESCSSSNGIRSYVFYRLANTGDSCDEVLNAGFNFAQYAYGPQIGVNISDLWYHGEHHSAQLDPIGFYGYIISLDGQNATGSFNVLDQGESPVVGQPAPTKTNPWLLFSATWNATRTGANWLALSFLNGGTYYPVMNGDAFVLWYDRLAARCYAADALLYQYGTPNLDSQNDTCVENVHLASCSLDGDFITVSAWRLAFTGDVKCDYDLRQSAAIQWAFGPVNPGDNWFTDSWYHGDNHATAGLYSYTFIQK